MTDMIEQLLDLTRARLAGGLDFVRVRQYVDVASLVRRTVEELRGTHLEREVVVQGNGDCSSAGDPDRLLQLFSNLIANALHHGEAGSPISVTVEGGDREIVVCIANRGLIPPDLLPQIFDPFRGRQGQSSQSRGLGLGLFISQQIAIAHGGSVSVQSNDAVGGTVFTVRIPRSVKGARQAAAAGELCSM